MYNCDDKVQKLLSHHRLTLKHRDCPLVVGCRTGHYPPPPTESKTENTHIKIEDAFLQYTVDGPGRFKSWVQPGVPSTHLLWYSKTSQLLR